MSVNSKMTAINNKIRSLLNLTGIMGLDAMAANLGTAVSENDQQAVLIQQIKAALEGKMAVTFPYLSNPGAAGDLLDGKQLIDGNGNVVTGTLVPASGFVIKTGTTTSNSINTGLSDIEQFFIYKESVNATGLIRMHYDKNGKTNRMYASSWSSSGTKAIVNRTDGGLTVNGGSVTITATAANSGGLTSNTTYTWVAVGTE